MMASNNQILMCTEKAQKEVHDSIGDPKEFESVM